MNGDKLLNVLMFAHGDKRYEIGNTRALRSKTRVRSISTYRALVVAQLSSSLTSVAFCVVDEKISQLPR